MGNFFLGALIFMNLGLLGFGVITWAFPIESEKASVWALRAVIIYLAIVVLVAVGWWLLSSW